MAVVKIPIRNDIPAYTQSTELDGVGYVLSFRFSERNSRWFFDILDEAGVALVEGIKILSDIDLNSRFKSEGLPKGIFIATDDSGRAQQPNRLNFSNEVSLYYAEEEDVLEILNG